MRIYMGCSVYIAIMDYCRVLKRSSYKIVHAKIDHFPKFLHLQSIDLISRFNRLKTIFPFLLDLKLISLLDALFRESTRLTPNYRVHQSTLKTFAPRIFFPLSSIRALFASSNLNSSISGLMGI